MSGSWAAASTGRPRQGCVEFGSAAEVDNADSAAAHRALGIAKTGVVRCFKKGL